ncbi:MAG: ribonuclease III [Pirellulales bacterium]
MSTSARQDDEGLTPRVNGGAAPLVRSESERTGFTDAGEVVDRPLPPVAADAGGSSSQDASLADPPVMDRMAQCEERLGYVFRDKSLLRAALTHASGAEHRLASNERLEFLGDAVLGFVVCDILFRNYPAFQEGELTRVKSSVVSRQTCAKLSSQLGLHEFLILGKGMASSGAVPQSLMADVFESLIAAMYLDGGDEVARDFLGRSLSAEIAAAVALAHSDNAKSLLQQIAQRRFGATPSYHLLDEKGPDHSKCFKMSARAGSRDFTPAWGRNKKEAEQRAACNALAELNGEPAPFLGDD